MALAIVEEYYTVKDYEKCFVWGEAKSKISKATILRSNVSIVCRKLKKYIIKFPIIIFKIISASTRLRDERLKKGLYKINKIPFFYVLVYPDKKVVILDLKVEEKKTNKVILTTHCKNIEITKEEILEEKM